MLDYLCSHMDTLRVMSIEAVQTSGPVIPEWSFGDRLRKVRREVAQLDQNEFADTLGVGRQGYAAWESGRTSPRDIVALAKRVELATGVPAAWMLGIETSAPPARLTGRTEGTTGWYYPQYDRTVVPFAPVAARRYATAQVPHADRNHLNESSTAA